MVQASIISQSLKQCHVVPPYPNVVYSQSPLNYLTWFSAGAISNTIIPSVQQLINNLVSEYAVGGVYAGQPMSNADMTTLVTLQTQIIAWEALITQNEQLKLNSVAWPELLGGTINWNLNDVINNLQPAETFAKHLATEEKGVLIEAVVKAYSPNPKLKKLEVMVLWKQKKMRMLKMMWMMWPLMKKQWPV